MWLAQAHTRQTSSIICNLLYVSITVHFVSTFYVMSKNSLYSNYCYSSWAQRQPEEKLSICQPAMSNIQFYTVAVYRSSDTRTEILKSTHYFGVCRRKCKWTFFCTFHCDMQVWDWPIFPQSDTPVISDPSRQWLRARFTNVDQISVQLNQVQRWS